MKPKTCRRCKAEFSPRNSLQVVCSPLCGIAYARVKAAAKIKKQRDKQRRLDAEQKKTFKLNDIPHQKELTQKVFNKLRKLQELKWFRDRGWEPECISCGGIKMDWCCGHFKTVASSGALRFSQKNTYLQCNRYCNKGKSGNIEGCKNTRGYKKGLVERFGYPKAIAIMDWCEQNQSKVARWTGPELVEMRKRFNKEIKELEKCQNIEKNL